jgi:sterol desaturase/sphingolipid hydroxylase (fatty acid hydroxylase superfamily)/ketosteroid isomerase-like protein
MLLEFAQAFAARYVQVLTVKSQVLILATLPLFLVLGPLWQYVVVLKGGERSLRNAIRTAFPVEDFRAVTFRTDLFCTFAAHLLTRPLVRMLMRLVLAASSAQLMLTFLNESFGRPGSVLDAVPAIVALQAAAYFLTDEFSIYFVHYLQHRVPILWASHRTHHSAEALTLLTAPSRLTVLPLPTDLLFTVPTDFLIKGLVMGPVLYWTTPTLHPVAIALIGYIAIYAELNEWFAHSRIRVSYGWANRIFNAPVLHHLHHSAELQHRDRNFGHVLSIYDWIFGTLYVPARDETWRLGIDASEIGARNPHIRIRDYLFEPYRYWWASVRSLQQSLGVRMTRKAIVGVAVPLLFVMVASSIAGDISPRAQDEATIWKLEQAIYAGGSGGSNLANYVAAMDPEYAGWPPQAASPLGYEHIVEAAKKSGNKGVELELRKDLVRVHREGNVALAYYTTHRTVRAGAAVDESFETLHVWIREADGQWKLFGAMVRPATHGG